VLGKRLIAAFGFILPMLLLFWLDTYLPWGCKGSWLGSLTLVINLLIALEVVHLCRERTPGPIAWIVYVGTALVTVAVMVPELFSLPGDFPIGRWGWSGLAVGVTLAASFLVSMLPFKDDGVTVVRLALTIFAVLYSGWLLSFLLATRMMLPAEWGPLAVFSTLFIIKMSDAGAYFVGKRFGRHKLAPRISPGKTIEGLLGGIVFAVIASILFFHLIVPSVVTTPLVDTPWWAKATYAASLTMVGVFGDLCESVIKRDMRRKDSSGWLPGLGGVLDTADSVLLAAPITFLWWNTGLLGP
jgi:phosphatidate cytidylyltransferase